MLDADTERAVRAFLAKAARQYDVLLETGIRIQPLPKNIDREGVRLQ